MSSTLPPILFIGGGNMGGALISGLIAGGTYKAQDIYVSDPTQSQLDSMAQKYPGINVSTATTPEFLQSATIILLAVKPAIVPLVCAQIGSYIDVKKHIIVSICGGVSTTVIRNAIQIAQDPTSQLSTFQLPVIRVMPNTPSLVMAGASGIAKGSFVTDDQLKMVSTIFNAVGSCVTVNEYDLHAVTGVSGSGPAYVIAFTEALIQGGVAAGLTVPLSTQLAIDTLYGTAKMLKESNQHPAVLREMICSPGGTTIAALHALHKEGMPNAVIEGVLAAANRSKEMAAKAELVDKAKL